jgi:hypothetical protein
MRPRKAPVKPTMMLSSGLEQDAADALDWMFAG